MPISFRVIITLMTWKKMKSHRRPDERKQAPVAWLYAACSQGEPPPQNCPIAGGT
jgi:hypothetical protein